MHEVPCLSFDDLFSLDLLSLDGSLTRLAPVRGMDIKLEEAADEYMDVAPTSQLQFEEASPDQPYGEDSGEAFDDSAELMPLSSPGSAMSDQPAHRCGGLRKRKRLGHNKKQPTRREFNSEAEFQIAWHQWRDDRDHNNESVKKSRLRAKQKKVIDDRRRRQQQLESRTVEQQVQDMQGEITLLIKALTTPGLLTRKDHTELKNIISLRTGQ